MEVRVIHDAAVTYAFLKNKTRYNYIYQLNNLAQDQWKNVVCYGLLSNNEILQIAMLNINYGIPVLLAAGFDNGKYSVELIRSIKKFLPHKFYTHIDKITLEALFQQNKIYGLEEFMNMGIDADSLIEEKHASEAVRLGYEHIADIKELLSISYPDAWLDDDLVKLNENFGIYIDEKLISFAGIHAYSEQYQVAAIAHVTTHPELRNKGYAEQVVDALVASLSKRIKYIGLNVRTNNIHAINCYKKLGFQEYGRFAACEVEND